VNLIENINNPVFASLLGKYYE